MSDRGAETGFAPIALTAAVAGRGGFQPRSFAAPAPETVVEAEPALPEADPAEDPFARGLAEGQRLARSAEHTSDLQSLMRLSYAVFCLDKKKAEMNTTNADA